MVRPAGGGDWRGREHRSRSAKGGSALFSVLLTLRCVPTVSSTSVAAPLLGVCVDGGRHLTRASLIEWVPWQLSLASPRCLVRLGESLVLLLVMVLLTPSSSENLALLLFCFCPAPDESEGSLVDAGEFEGVCFERCGRCSAGTFVNVFTG